MRVLVTGSRTWEDEDAIGYALAAEVMFGGGGPSRDHILVHGGAKGADRMAARLCDRSGWTIEEHPADWDKYGKRAGFIRNDEKVMAGADVCLAFIRNGSPGATMCADVAEKAGIRVERFTQDD